MSVYDCVCKDCQKSFELVLTLGEHDKGEIACPKCESRNVEKDAVAFYAATSKRKALLASDITASCDYIGNNRSRGPVPPFSASPITPRDAAQHEVTNG